MSTQAHPPANPNKNAQAVLFFTIFIAMLGLSVLFPVIAPLARSLHLSETQTGWFATSYSLMQLLFSPIWGSMSEKFGRKPILIMGLLGFSASFGLFGFLAQLGVDGKLSGTALFVLLIATRVLGGIFSSATLPTAQAMMADISSKENRAASMGIIGAAFGLGVIFGPAIGAVLSRSSLILPLYFSSALAVANALIGLRILKETRTYSDTEKPQKENLLKNTSVLSFLVISAVITLANVGMEQTVGFLVQDTLKLSSSQTAMEVGKMLVVFGLSSVFIQGFLIRKVSKTVSPQVLILSGLAIMCFGMMLMSFANSFLTLAFSLVVVGIGGAIVGPSISSALSLSVPSSQQGIIAGLNSSALALGRMSGPLISTALYQDVSHRAPYIFGGVILVVMLAWVAIYKPSAKA